MAELTLIVSDFYQLPPTRAAGELPRLPELERLLARGRVEPLAGGWRPWLALRFGGERLAREPPAALAARAWLNGSEAAEAPRYWLATPVHLVAGLDRVHLHPAGLLHLSAAQQRELAQDFARVFHDSPWRLQPLGQRELLLAGPALAADGIDPARCAGSDPTPGLAQGSEAGILRRLWAEIEMWLHEHPVNAQRVAGGQLPVTSLWPWGAGARSPPDILGRDAPRPARILADDVFAAALATLRGAAAQPPPALFTPELVDHGEDCVVVLPALGPAGLLELFSRLEHAWVAPALAALASGQLRALRLLIGGHGYRFARRRPGRPWRSIRPWWEALA